MKTPCVLLASVAVMACASSRNSSFSGGLGPAYTTSAEISEGDLRHRLYLIADDSMMGRESGSLGDFKAAAYVASEFQRLGLEPAGENGTWFQTVPFWNAAVDPASQLDVGSTKLVPVRDFLPAGIAARPRTLQGVQAVYGGPANDSSKWITAAQAAGKFVVLDLPQGVSVRQAVIGSARWRGAVAVAPVVLDVMGAESVARLTEGRPIPDSARNPNAVPTVWLSRGAATAMFGSELASLAPGTVSPTAISGYVDIARKPVPYPARNVVGILRGTDPSLRNTYVALTAHNDHVGFDHAPVDHDSIRAFNRVIRPMGADSPNREPTAAEWSRIHSILDSLRGVNKPRLDSIRNGADDDGSGTVSILEIAEAMARGARPRRSVLFVNHTGEEAGLLGSRWYSDHSTVPMDSIVAEIDQDMVGRGRNDDFPQDGTGAGNPTYMEVVGAKRLSREFGDSVEAANAREPLPFKFDYRYDAPGHPLQYYCRADHYSYARYGIPSMAISRGEHLDYHQVTDEAQYISYPDLARVTRMVYSAAMTIGNMSHRPALDAPKQTNPNAMCRQ